MPFARQQVAALRRIGVEANAFFLESRTDLRAVLGEFRRLRARIASDRPDVVHAQFGTVTALVAVLASNRPVVVTYRGSDLNHDPSTSRLRSWTQKALSHLAALRAAAVICVSRELEGHLSWRRRGVHVIPTGVDTTIFQPRDRQEARRTLGWPEETPTILFNRGGSPIVKRADLAEAVVRAVEARIGPVRFEVMNGQYTPDRVCLAMNAADLLLLTSDWEGSPTVIQEAMACGLPVVSVAVGDVEERIAGVTPSTIAVRDPEALAAAAVAILAERRRSNGAEVAKAISHDAIAHQLVAIYRAALGK